MKTKTIVGILLVLTATLGISAGIVWGQEGVLGRLQPLLVDIQQQIPADVTFVIEGTQPQTVTVPISLDINLQISLSSTMTPVITLTATNPALVTVSQLLAEGSPLVDNNELPYEMETADGVEIIQWRVSEDFAGNFEALGELKNVNEKSDLDSVEFVVSLYDEAGNLLGVHSGYMQLDSVKLDGTSPFRIISSTPLEDVARYLVQVQARFDR